MLLFRMALVFAGCGIGAAATGQIAVQHAVAGGGVVEIYPNFIRDNRSVPQGTPFTLYDDFSYGAGEDAIGSVQSNASYTLVNPYYLTGTGSASTLAKIVTSVPSTDEAAISAAGGMDLQIYLSSAAVFRFYEAPGATNGNEVVIDETTVADFMDYGQGLNVSVNLTAGIHDIFTQTASEVDIDAADIGTFTQTSSVTAYTYSIQAVPEPSTLALGLGFAGLLVRRRPSRKGGVTFRG